MTLNLDCPHCRRRFEVNETDFGQTVQCPHCTLLVSVMPPIKPTPPPPVLPPAPPKAEYRPLNGQFICTDCGETGNGAPQGNWGIELILWLLTCIGGVAYTAWRHQGKSCKKCGGKMVKVSSPKGVFLIKQYHPGQRLQ